MSEDNEKEKWAANFAFTGNEEAIKKVKDLLNNLEESGHINDVTGISGPFESLQLMLKRRVENLSLENNSGQSKPTSEPPQGSSDSGGN